MNECVIPPKEEFLRRADDNDTDGNMIILGDMPLITVDTINVLIDEFNTQNPSFDVSDFEDYFEDLNGLHIQAGVQVKVLIFNAFINARYTFITKNSSQIERTGFSNILLGLALGL